MSTITGYIGKVFASIQKVFPNHKDYKGWNLLNWFPPWYTEMRARFQKDYSKFVLDNLGDRIFGVTKILPLYRDNGLILTTGPYATCDLKNIMHQLLLNAKRLNGLSEERLQILLIYNCIAWAVEVQFPNFSDWEWHPSLNILDITWTEMKHIQEYAMRMVPDCGEYAYLFDFMLLLVAL